ncbi:hypothetical protein BX264_1346 [Streptomyces sp. 2333.5]|nr:hypothetical protein BX264_1346 [Streptomyces sp. 2333.5]SEC34767.1 hypothetical protein SAMN05428943_1481 [Streptomyces sp. 2314.4]SED17157.1 hypothetical protein SAMN05428942_1350 [Streptomyces sp. 2112.2]
MWPGSTTGATASRSRCRLTLSRCALRRGARCRLSRRGCFSPLRFAARRTLSAGPPWGLVAVAPAAGWVGVGCGDGPPDFVLRPVPSRCGKGEGEWGRAPVASSPRPTRHTGPPTSTPTGLLPSHPREGPSRRTKSGGAAPHPTTHARRRRNGEQHPRRESRQRAGAPQSAATTTAGKPKTWDQIRSRLRPVVRGPSSATSRHSSSISPAEPVNTAAAPRSPSTLSATNGRTTEVSRDSE